MECRDGLQDIVSKQQRDNRGDRANRTDSNFSPVPLRVMDGSEPGESTAAAVVSGAPIELQARTVR